MSAAGPPLPSVLVIDDELIIRSNLAEFLQQEGFAVQTAASGELGLQMLSRHKFDAVLCDVNLPGIDGIEVLERAAQASPETFVLLITAYATVESAIDAFHKGVSDYLMKPIILKEVERKLRRLLAERDLFRENQRLRRELNRADEAGEMVVGTTPVMRQVVAMARKTAGTPTTVLITGESGTGKELLARWIHAAAQGTQSQTRFVPINCAAIPSDDVENYLFGCGDVGTLFLDEIGELPAAAQAKLLRVIEQKESLPAGASEPRRLTARIIAATNKDLPRDVEGGRFREDLFYRLNVVGLSVPPLRDRREDIPELVGHLLAKHVRALGKKIAGTTHEALRVLRAGVWKGNIRELANVLQRAVILGDGPMITPADLPPDLTPRGDDPSAVDELSQAVERFEKLH
ncbi:MAG TPA: sigma-54 dependent transcriptional regulator, partial [Gemmataceae bacterium]